MPSVDSLNSDPERQLMARVRMRQVSLLLAVKDLGTLHRAASALGMSQPAATKMLSELEEALGHPLFERLGRGLALTDAGRRVIPYFEGVRGTFASLKRELADIESGDGGHLRIGAIMAGSEAMLTDALVEIKRRFPALSISISEKTSDQLLRMLEVGEVDLVIARLAGTQTRANLFRPLAQEKLSIVAAPGHPLASRRSLRFSELLDHPWILQLDGSPMRHVIEQEFRHHGEVIPPGLIETSSISVTVNLCSATQQLAVLPSVVAARYSEHGLVAVLDYELKHALSEFGTVVKRDRPLNQAAEKFVEILHGVRK